MANLIIFIMLIENPIPKEKIKRENTHLGITSHTVPKPICTGEKSPPRTRKKENSLRGSNNGKDKKGSASDKRKEDKTATPKHQHPIADYYTVSSKIIGQ